MIGPATHFTSHAWAYRFADLVDALKGDVGAIDEHGATCYFWLDLFVVPQRAPVTPPQVRPTSSIFPRATPLPPSRYPAESMSPTPSGGLRPGGQPASSAPSRPSATLCWWPTRGMSRCASRGAGACGKCTRRSG